MEFARNGPVVVPWPGERHLLALSRPFDWMPGDVARDLLAHGCELSDVALVCERLTRDDEAITRTTVDELARHAGGTARSDTPFRTCPSWSSAGRLGRGAVTRFGRHGGTA